MAKMGIKGLVKSNLIYWLEDLLLREGLYNTVSRGELDPYNNDMSELTFSDEPLYPSGSVWQSAFKNWVHESGITVSESGLLPPIVCSGVYVNGTFYAHDSGSPSYDAAYAHVIDYPNGRVIFETPQSGPIQAEFSYKMVTIDAADSFGNENRPLLIETAIKDNPLQTGVQTYPTAASRTLPAIWVEIIDRTSKGYEIGSASLIADLKGVFHIWSMDGYIADLLEDILVNKQHSVIIGIDFNRADFPLDHNGDKNTGFSSFMEMSNIHHPLRWRRIYLNEVSAKQQKPLYEVQRTRVDFLARVYPNF